MLRLLMSLAVLGMVLAPISSAADSGGDCLKAGDGISPFYVTKIAGAEDDGVETGKELCYRCRYGQRPMVMVFTRSADGEVGKLVKALDSAVQENESAELKGLVTFLGENRKGVENTAAKFAKSSGTKAIPFVVAEDVASGPSRYKIGEDAAVTVVVAKESQVVASHQFKSASDVDVAAVMGEVTKMLK
ncbi:MAG: hypothetical protein AAF802_17450 [Planctomycetota bacterium]